ncbi:MAG: isocitrate/isopropylmalate dehydrogenase family protein [Vicinamibacteria bacterium]|jgi:isocitrate dehydrogenase (NAD+)|nr:isocitrate/isopropylmalate dehydrogenase family protein [Vicinamibacteria bacterium]MBP9948325.1 isocitrate/isopropylmalate dehydrogenase family protein [Vicinamibacteria bacterium]
MSGTRRGTLIAGDGIGPEVVSATVRVIEATGVKIEWDSQMAGAMAIATEGTPLPQKTLDSIRANGLALKGPTTTPIGSGHASINVALRKGLDLYANVRPIKTLPGVKSRYDNVDLVIIRENTEDLYSGLEHIVVPGVVESIKVITEKASTRIARFAFNYARAHGRKRITAVHKANIMKLSDGLFLDCCLKVAADFPDIKYDDIIVDNCCMQLVLDPTRFDMLLLENLYGDIVSDLCAGLVGGLGLAPGANIGEKGATFEAVHGSAPDIAGKNIANPIALILSGALLLDYIGELEAGNRVRAAVADVLREGKHMPKDLGGSASTSEVEEAIATRISG